MEHQLLLCVLSICLAEVAANAPRAGPYNIVMKELQTCEDEGTGQFHFESKITKSSNGKYVYNQPFFLGFPVDENLNAQVEVQQWGNQGWRRRAIEVTVKGCDEIWKHAKDFVLSFLKSSDHPDVKKCPIPAGNYTVNNWEINIEIKSIPVMTYNSYRAFIVMFHKTTKIGCVIFIADVIPKPKN